MTPHRVPQFWSRAGRSDATYLRVAQAYMLISMPTSTSTIFGAFQVIDVLQCYSANSKDCRSGEPLTQASSPFPSTQHETFVTAFRGLVAFLQVHWHAARIGEQLALLAGYVCSHVPRLRSWK